MTNNDNLEPLCFQHPPLCLFSKYPALDSHPSHQRSTQRSLWNPTSTVLYVPGLIAQSVIFIHVQCFAISPSFFLNHIPSIYVKIVHFKYEFNACCFETYKSAALIGQPCQNPLNPSHGLAFHSWLTCFSLWEFTMLYKKGSARQSVKFLFLTANNKISSFFCKLEWWFQLNSDTIKHGQLGKHNCSSKPDQSQTPLLIKHKHRDRGRHGYSTPVMKACDYKLR